jgi:hypothetical protein
MSLIGLLITLVIFCTIVWAARALMAAFGIGDPIATIVWVVLVLIFLFWLLNAFNGGNFGNVGSLRLR